jgi:hypothetical protein
VPRCSGYDHALIVVIVFRVGPVFQLEGLTLTSNCQGLNSNPGHYGSFTFILSFVGESRLLVSWCAGGRCGMVGSDEDSGKIRRPSAHEDEKCRFLG